MKLTTKACLDLPLTNLVITQSLERKFTIIIINLFIIDNKKTIKKIFLSTDVALKTWLI